MPTLNDAQRLSSIHPFIILLSLFRSVAIIFDEIKIQEGLVFEKETGLIIAYVDTGNFNEKIKAFESHIVSDAELEEVATHSWQLTFTFMEYL